MKKVFSIASMLLASHLQAAILPTQSDYYYRLGGASDIFIPPVTRDQTVTLGGAIHTGGLNCHLFNPVVSITNTFNDLKNTAVGVPAAVIDGLKGSAAGFPMYKLQQSLPGLYNVLQNSSMGAQNEFALRVSDCQQVKRNQEEGKSPIDSVLSVSDSQGWIDSMKRAKKGEAVDITKSAKDIAQKSEEYGIPWVHRNKGNAGGKNQVPIHVISDVVVAGYNLMLTPSRDLDDMKAPAESSAKLAGFVRYWSTPAKAAQWAVMVLGDIQISVKNDKDSRSAQAGLGLSNLLKSCPKIGASTTCVANVSDFLWRLITKKETLTETNLRRISAANVLITEDIITGIQRMPREQQLLTVSKLSEEIAIQNLLDEAINLRRLLQAGFQIQEVQNLKPVQTMVMQALTKLDKEIKSLSFENEVRKKLMTDTLNLIMDLRTHELASSSPGNDHEQGLVKNGAIYRSTDTKE